MLFSFICLGLGLFMLFFIYDYGIDFGFMEFRIIFSYFLKVGGWVLRGFLIVVRFVFFNFIGVFWNEFVWMNE